MSVNKIPKRTLYLVIAVFIIVSVTIASVFTTSGSHAKDSKENMLTSTSPEFFTSLQSAVKNSQLLSTPTSLLPTTTTTTTTTTTHHHHAPTKPLDTSSAQSAPSPTGGSGDPYDNASWYRLYECESGRYGWSANTGNGYYGGLQFSLSSWRAVNGAGRPDQATPEEQIARGKLLWEQGGWAHWPACTSKFGWR